MASRPTPHSIALCALIVLHYEGASEDVEDEQPLDDSQQQQQHDEATAAASPLYPRHLTSSSQSNPSLRDVRHAVEAFLQETLLQQGRVEPPQESCIDNDNQEPSSSSTGPTATTIQSIHHDRSISELVQALGQHVWKATSNGQIQETLVSSFLQWLSVAATSVDALYDLMSTLQQSVTHANPVIDAASVSGLYIRSVCCLGYPALSFAETGRLWNHLQHEVQDATNGTTTTTTTTTDWPLSPNQMEDLLRQTCQQLGGHGQELVQIVSSQELPSAHFLRFLQCLRSKERVGAMDALHAYFDHVLIRRRGHAAADHLQILQFAAILLAALHYETGDVVLARLATEEAVRVAQQSQDAAGCVAYSLGWLSQTISPGNHQSPAEWMERCVERSVEGHLRSLVAGANLSRVQQCLWEPSSATQSAASPSDEDASQSAASPQEAWNYLFAASTTENLETSHATTHFIPPHDRPVHMTHVRHSEAALNILAQQRLVTAAIWDAYHQPAASALASWLALGSPLSADHAATAIPNLARTALYGSPQNLWPSEAGTTCIYGKALSCMCMLQKSLKLSLDSSFGIEVALVLHEWALSRDDLSDAKGWMRYLLSHIHPGMTNHSSIQLDIYIQQSKLYMAEKKYNKAKQLLKEQLKTSQARGLPLHTAWILLLLGKVLIESAPKEHERKQQCCINAVPYLLQCLNLCETRGMEGLHAMALSILARVHLAMHRLDACIVMIDAALPTILQQGHISFQAQAYLTLAHCQLQKAHKLSSKQKDHLHKRCLDMAMRALENAQSLFVHCQDGNKLKEVYYLQAHIWNATLDCEKQRDQAAQKFANVSNYLERACCPKQSHVLSLEGSKLEQLANRAFVVV